MPDNAILRRMQDRLYASMVRGPGLNCRPHSSRQRVDLMDFCRLEDLSPRDALIELLGENRQTTLSGRVPPPPDVKQTASAIEAPAADDEGPHPEDDEAHRRWRGQKTLLNKLRNLSEDARTYEQDTGAHALNIGYPVLSMPPAAIAGSSMRILAPIAFVPVSLTVRTGHKAGLDLACYGRGTDLVIPNAALLAWLERQTGKPTPELFADEEGNDPWREIRELIEYVTGRLEITIDDPAAWTDPQQLILDAVPKMEDLHSAAHVYRSVVLGLFPATNEALLRDMQAMIEAPSLDGPINSFISIDATLEGPPEDGQEDSDELQEREVSARCIADERLIAAADPCQARTVAHARQRTGLVVHGPPGTGKSQTITNIIGDHLARGQRVLFICDKRTALDVVANRLDHVGLGGLCALVHDPQRDQRDLYMAIRSELESLAEAKTYPSAERDLAKLETELQKLHDLLTEHHDALMKPQGDEPSFHELISQWMAIDCAAPALDDALDHTALTIEAFDECRQDVEVVFQRGVDVAYPTNPWVDCAGLTLEAYLRGRADDMRRALASCVDDARHVDATGHESIPPFDALRSLDEQSALRADLAQRLQRVIDRVNPQVAARCGGWSDEAVGLHRARLHEMQSHLDLLRSAAPDAELDLTAREMKPTLAAVSAAIGDLDDYLDAVSRWYGFLMLGPRLRGSKAMRKFGLRPSADEAARLRQFLMALRSRMVLSDVHRQLTAAAPETAAPVDGDLIDELDQHWLALDALHATLTDKPLVEAMRRALSNRDEAPTVLDGLRRSAERAAALKQFEQSMKEIGLFDDKWLKPLTAQLRDGRQAGSSIQRLESEFDSLETVLRINDDLSRLPKSISALVREQLKDGAAPEIGLAVIKKTILGCEITRRMNAAPLLRSFDGQKVEHSFQRYRELEAQRHHLVCQIILHRWRTKQKQRLLVGTGSRLNSDGARLRQRLFVRGRRAMRLRQVIHIGRDMEGGDPLFDLCPVWMASPETVAQIFPRQVLFDVAVFDEASQCKLEEALPVLTRAHRVVIAGDPKQLPPTRFFETSVTISDDDELETDQDLFESQQREIEDLLAAALNLEIQESYLDVHYRSRNADLIAFSNDQFYHQRLQAIPGHPSNRARFAPITMHRVEGMYDNRCNAVEGLRVCEIVRDLLRRAEPPSIGIATFNLVQRDLIIELLDAMANEDAQFARRLAEARSLRGEASFEGLFVKNLESVQGDERDHIIISTTYGPNPEGRFYQRFGPLGRAGGGRRLNVLVTRARHEVHLVTSIPREAYASTVPIPPGAAPNGGWLLFAYLRYAEELAEIYEKNHRELAQAVENHAPAVYERPIEPFSPFAAGVGRLLCEQCRLGSDVHWGNEGFRIDVAVHHPRRVEDMTVGVLCDFAQFRYAQDPVEWDAFRTAVHASQGWRLRRIWSPQFFRDPQRCLNQIRSDVEAILEKEAEANREITE